MGVNIYNAYAGLLKMVVDTGFFGGGYDIFWWLR